MDAGEGALELEKKTKEELEHLVLSHLRIMYPDKVDEIIVLDLKSTTWGSYEHFLGANSFVNPTGSLADYDVMAEPINHLFFAGEHTNSEFPGSVHGAYLSGRRAAEEVVAKLREEKK